MPKIDKHSPGSFCWIELGTTDQGAAKSFYSGLLGWTPLDMPMGPSEYYTIFQVEEQAAAAGYTLPAELRSMGVPPHWLLYVCVESADDAAKRTLAHGGKVMKDAFEVGDYGRMAVLQDPAGATFAVWQPRQNQGIGIAGVDGTLCWADLNTSDPHGAGGFYSELFGWKMEPGKGDGYLHIKNGESFIGGVPMNAHLPPNTPPHWLAYFQVSDCAATVDQAKQLGGQAYFGPEALPEVGTIAVIADPQGAVFALYQPKAH